MKPYRMTYATMFDPPEELHTWYEAAFAEITRDLGNTHGMLISGKDILTGDVYPINNPADKRQILGYFQAGTEKHVDQAVAAAKGAFPAWSRTAWQDRVILLDKAADLIEKRLFKIASTTTLEVGKNRLEALGDVSEAPALIRYVCRQMEDNQGFITTMGQDPIEGYQVHNISLLRPYGVWLVISPFNFPAALTAGPVGAALAAGNTVVMKPAAKTSWSVRLLADCFRDAGIPDGVVNLVTGSGGTVGQALIDHPDLDGVTFTGSYPVGMGIYRQFAARDYIHPVILELGGKNPAIVTKNADLERAANGIVRSAFGLQGQKCAANSRVYLEEPIYDQLLEQIAAKTKKLVIGDPGQRDTYLGPVISEESFHDYQKIVSELNDQGSIVSGGKISTSTGHEDGYFVEPTVAANLPLEHPFWKKELFLPITLVHKVKSLEDALRLANDTNYGLTAGFYGSEEESERFFEASEAGVNYVNRPQGSTTGAWPSYQPFGGWKSSGSSGVGAGGTHYLQRYMREQVRSTVR
ncbi:MAG: aldehyde dehydrogenase family protein [Chloroflexi bacterium]|nr:aldehyde dehydrogenase family protein [Chloroflexota bacterium]